MDPKRRYFETVSHKDLLTINNNESVFFGSKMGQTKLKSLRAKGFLTFFAKNCGLHLEHILFFKKIQEIEYYYVNQIIK